MNDYALSKAEVDAEAFSALMALLFYGAASIQYNPEELSFATELTVAIYKRITEIENDIVSTVIDYIQGRG